MKTSTYWIIIPVSFISCTLNNLVIGHEVPGHETKHLASYKAIDLGVQVEIDVFNKVANVVFHDDEVEDLGCLEK